MTPQTQLRWSPKRGETAPKAGPALLVLRLLVPLLLGTAFLAVPREAKAAGPCPDTPGEHVCTIYAWSDTFTEQAQPQAVHGQDAQLEAYESSTWNGTNRHLWLAFTTQDIPAPATVSGATISLWSTADAATGLLIRQVPNPYQCLERNCSWASAGAVSTLDAGGTSAVPALGTWTHVPVRALQTVKVGPGSDTAYRIRPTNPDTPVRFASGEGDPAHAPRLTVSYTVDDSLFADDAPWNTALPADPAIATKSTGIVHNLASDGQAYANLYNYGTPVFDAGAQTAKHPVTCTMAWGTCDLQRAPVPIPDRATPSPGNDGAMVVIDWSTRTAYEFWQARNNGDGTWTASWGDTISIDSQGAPSFSTGSGVSLLAGLIRTQEIASGRIEHALAFSSKYTCSGSFVAPAVKTDGTSTDPNCIPMGSRVQLDPTLDLATLDLNPAERAIATALQRYGAVARNSSGASMAFGFENPAGDNDPYPSAGLTHDYYAIAGIPLDRLRVLAP